MLIKLKVRYVLLMFVLFFFGASSFGEVSDSRWLVWPELLRHSGLEIVWQNELPFKKGESLRDLHILGGRLYAVSDRNYMVSMDREKGTVVFSRSVGLVGFPVLGLEVYKDELFSIIGNKLVEMNPAFGTERSVERLSFSAVCPAARNSSYFYVGGVDRRVHALAAEDKLQFFEVAADNDSKITSVVASEGFFVFGTDAGNVISITADRPKRLWQFEAGEAIVGQIVKDGGALIFASEDTNVYKISATTGKLIWKYQTAAKLEKSPRVTREVVYQYVRNKGLSAIDKQSGALKWQLAEGVDLLAEADGRVYVITKDGTLVMMDNKQGKRLYSVNFAEVSRYAVNVEDSKIYISDKAGKIACLKQIEN